MSALSKPSHGLGLLSLEEQPFWRCKKRGQAPPFVQLPGFSCRASAGRSPPQRAPPPNKKSTPKTDDFHGTLEALQSKNRVPKKWLGQHYMVNQEINEKLVETANLEKNDLVLEIGPGTGALTNYLVEAGAHVIAVEKDPAMAQLIMERFQGSGRVEVVQEDFMKWPIRSSIDHVKESLSAKGISIKLAKVVSNLPFNITTPVVKRILPMGDIFSSMVLLIQDETASRLVDASPQSNEYRPVSVFVQFFSEEACLHYFSCFPSAVSAISSTTPAVSPFHPRFKDAHYKLKVSRNNFFPRPNVDAAVVLFKIKQTPEYPSVTSARSFFTLVNSAFGGKRKMLRNSLQHLYPSTDIREALKSVDLLDTARPDELSLHEFVALYNALDVDQQKLCVQEVF